MVVWKMTLKTPEFPDGRDIIVIANDMTHKIGSFGPQEDLLFKVKFFGFLFFQMFVVIKCCGCRMFSQFFAMVCFAVLCLKMCVQFGASQNMHIELWA
jgi:hypothetical protein